ncbi:MAG: mannose-1-phosphate guanylyltransferase/mannose-6-phosphate isomerase [Gammaproteobacteria bacterium]
MIVPVILSGGSGSRLWPLSRELYPTQLLPLVGERTMIQDTMLRLRGLSDVAPPVIVCNQEHRFLVAEQLRRVDVKPAAILLEPEGRNTAPAAAIAAARILEQGDQGDDPILLVLPADHVIRDVKAFHSAIETGARLARDGALVTFGIVPDRPETGYGYIRAAAGDEPSAVAEFVEKPDAEAAAKYCASGEYFWNSGMFMFRASRYIEELRAHAPDMVSACVGAVAQAKADLDFIRVGEEAFRACPSDSIDYAVMEKTDAAMVVPLAAGWSDVGSWSSLHDVSDKDSAGNVKVGDVLAEDTRNCFLYASGRLVATVGLEDCIVVETKDAVMVAPKGRGQDVKMLVEALRRSGRGETALHREVFRPWGSYDGIDQGDRFQVKRITVKPGAVLSLQMHHHRAEHWIVVQGTARVTRGEDEFLLGENESTYIPMGMNHRLENPGKVPLHLIEVQSGAYLGEDDIVRFEDTNGREPGSNGAAGNKD